jgi:hypothetical protein
MIIWLALLAIVVVVNVVQNLTDFGRPAQIWTRFERGGKDEQHVTFGPSTVPLTPAGGVVTPTRFVGGLRRDSFNATKPLAVLTIDADGVALEPRWRVLAVSGFSSIKIDWAQIDRVEPCRVLLSTGVRFYGPWRKLIFWTGRHSQTQVLAACRAVAPDKIGRAPQ